MYKKILSIVLVLALTLTMFSAFGLTSFATNDSDGFVYTDGTKFICNGNYFYVAGTNAYDLFTKQYGGSGSGITIDKAEIDKRMAEMEDIGMNVIRVWGFGSTGGYTFETAPGVYNEGTFTVMDYVLYSAQQHNIKVIITLENYWGDYGGIDAKLEWAGASGGSHVARRAWYTNAKCQQWYKNYFNYFANLVNTFTNEVYKDDTTIFAWDMMNEARYQNDSNYSDPENLKSENLRNWVDTMGAYMKSIDSNHMICVGIEGHGSKYGFGGNEGNDFVHVQQSEYLDFCCAHPYPDEYWANLSPAQTKTMMQKWINDAHDKCGKPFLVTEFNVDKQDPNIEAYWRAVYDTLYENDAGGALFWCYDTRSLSHFTMEKTDPVVSGYFTDHCALVNAKNVAVDMTQLSPSRVNIDTSKAITKKEVKMTYFGTDSLTAIKNGTKTLTKGTDYTVSGTTVTITADYIESLSDGATTLTFVVGTKNPTFTLYLYDGSKVDTDTEGSGGNTDTDEEENYDFWYLKYQCEKDFTYSGADWMHESCTFGGANCVRPRGDTGTVKVTLPEAETYTITLRAGSMYDAISVPIKIDGANAGTFSVTANGDTLKDYSITKQLSAGEHTITLTYPDVYNAGCDYLMITCEALNDLVETDTDTETDVNTDSDTDTVTDTDTNTDTDTDINTDTSTDTEPNTDTDSNVDTDSNTDSDTDSDTNTDTDTDGVILGDVNNDGVADIIDVVLMRAHIIKTQPITDADTKARADMNKDDVIDIIDVAVLRSKIVNG